MKKQLLALTVLLVASFQARAQLNTTPVAATERQKFVCFMDRHDGMPDYEFHVIADWNGAVAEGVGLILAVNYGDPYNGVPDKRRLVERFNFEMVSEETPYEQYFKFSPNDGDKQLLITWRQDFAEDVPVQHYLKYKGVTYKFVYCQSQDPEKNYTTPGLPQQEGY